MDTKQLKRIADAIERKMDKLLNKAIDGAVDDPMKSWADLCHKKRLIENHRYRKQWKEVQRRNKLAGKIKRA